MVTGNLFLSALTIKGANPCPTDKGIAPSSNGLNKVAVIYTFGVYDSLTGKDRLADFLSVFR
jgi:hypothetical protein